MLPWAAAGPRTLRAVGPRASRHGRPTAQSCSAASRHPAPADLRAACRRWANLTRTRGSPTDGDPGAQPAAPCRPGGPAWPPPTRLRRRRPGSWPTPPPPSAACASLDSGSRWAGRGSGGGMTCPPCLSRAVAARALHGLTGMDNVDPDARHTDAGPSHRTPDSGHRTSDTERRTPDGHRTGGRWTRAGRRTLDGRTLHMPTLTEDADRGDPGTVASGHPGTTMPLGRRAVSL
jgi:hypothetical protein